MALTTPRTWAAAEVPTPTQFTDHISQNFLGLRHAKSLQNEEAVVNTSVAFESLPGLSFPVKSGETWVFWASVYFVTNAAADAKFTVLAPVGSTGRFGVLHNGATNLSHSNVFGDRITLSVAATDEEMATVVGLVTAGADGTVQIQGSQLASTAVNTSFWQESPIVSFRMVA
jgi:hypothetical protein